MSSMNTIFDGRADAGVGCAARSAGGTLPGCFAKYLRKEQITFFWLTWYRIDTAPDFRRLIRWMMVAGIWARRTVDGRYGSGRGGHPIADGKPHRHRPGKKRSSTKIPRYSVPSNCSGIGTRLIWPVLRGSTGFARSFTQNQGDTGIDGA